MKLRLSGYVVFVLCCVTALFAAEPSGSPVADAAMRGDRNAVRALLKEGADVSTAQGDGMTALHWAAEHGDVQMADMLLYAGASLGAQTRIGQYTPLHLASRAGSAPVVEALLKAGAVVSARSEITGVTALHVAAESGNADVVTLLLAHGADANAKEAQWGQTPLIFAAAQNRVAAIRVLLAHGANPSIATKTVDITRLQALEKAAGDRQRKVLEASVAKGEKPTPSQVQAAIEASREIFRSGKIPPPEKSDTGRGGRGRGAGGGNGADPEEINPPVASKGGLTPLLHAARQGYIDAAQALLDGGAQINEVAASDGTSPLLMAVINGQFDTAMFLIKHGADPNLASTNNGVTPLWAAVNTRWQPRTRFPQPEEMEQQKATSLDVMKALLDAGADVNARLLSHPWYLSYTGCGNRNCGLADTSGSAAFWRAAYATDLDALRLLASVPARIRTSPRSRRQSPFAAGDRLRVAPPGRTARLPRRANRSYLRSLTAGLGRFQSMPPQVSNTVRALPATPTGTPRADGCLW